MPKGVYKRTEMYKRKMSEIMKEVMNRPKIKAKMKEVSNRPEAIARMSGENNPMKRLEIKAKISGENSPLWKNVNELGYVGLHKRVEMLYGKPEQCEVCKTTKAKVYDWHNKSRENKTNKDNWLRLCRSCHNKGEEK